MPMSYGALASPGLVPGLTLRGWALVQVNAGVSAQTVVKSGGANPITAVTRNSAGSYSCTIGPAMADANFMIQLIANPNGSRPLTLAQNAGQGTNYANLNIYDSSTVYADPAWFWVGIYG